MAAAIRQDRASRCRASLYARALTWAFALAFVAQSIVLSAHMHLSPSRALAIASQLASAGTWESAEVLHQAPTDLQEHRDRAPGNDPSKCNFCFDRMLAGAAIVPTAALLVVVSGYYGTPRSASGAVCTQASPSHHWCSRAPPLA